MNCSAKRRRSLATHLAIIVGCLITLQAHTSLAASPSKLSAEWWQLFLSLPASGNPLLDNNGASCGLGQRGSEWFLVGSLGGAVTRTCSIPEGTVLFFPLINLVDVNTADQSARELRMEIDPCIDATTTLTLEVDGRSLPAQIKRVRSAVFAITLPSDNLFGLPAGTYSPAVDDGFYATLAPLDVGDHTIHFTAARGGCPLMGPDPFEVDVTYNLTVVPVTLR